MKRFWVIVALLGAGVLPRAQNTGRLLVLNKEDATLVFVDPDSGSVSGRVAVGEGPHELTVSSDGHYAFASNYGTGAAPVEELLDDEPGCLLWLVENFERLLYRHHDVFVWRARPHDIGLGRIWFGITRIALDHLCP